MVLGIQINKSGVWEAVSQTSYNIFIFFFYFTPQNVYKDT